MDQTLLKYWKTCLQDAERKAIALKGPRIMFKDIVKASRSYRGYDESYRFSREELEDFVDCARFAPSSVNAQPFRYYLAWENEEVDRIQKLTNWARALPQMQLPHVYSDN